MVNATPTAPDNADDHGGECIIPLDSSLARTVDVLIICLAPLVARRAAERESTPSAPPPPILH